MRFAIFARAKWAVMGLSLLLYLGMTSLPLAQGETQMSRIPPELVATAQAAATSSGGKFPTGFVGGGETL